jgi:hypothetical protein
MEVLKNPYKILVRKCKGRDHTEAFTLKRVAVLNPLKGKVDPNNKRM